MDKMSARKIVNERLNVIAADRFVGLHALTYKSTVKLLADLNDKNAAGSVLLYNALTKWREVPLSELERDFSSISFDYVPRSPRGSFPRKKYDIIFTPLYGFNDGGYRLGHGSGWYDRFLLTQPQALKVGVGLEAGRIDFSSEPHDIPMDILITEDRCEILQKRKRR